MPREPLVILDGVRLEVQGREVLVILTPFHCPDDCTPAVMTQISKSSQGFPFAFASREANEQYYVFGPAASPELKSKLDAGVQWTKIPIFGPEDAVSPRF